MRLKTKFQDADFKLGEVVDAGTYYGGSCEIKILACTSQGKPRVFDYDSLASMREKWEDVPEDSEEHWHIRDGEVYKSEIKYCTRIEKRKEIGNYFESKEKAKKALERLEAWERLKDKGFRFGGYELVDGTIRFMIDLRPLTPDDLLPDLDLLFCTEEMRND